MNRFEPTSCGKNALLLRNAPSIKKSLNTMFPWEARRLAARAPGLLLPMIERGDYPNIMTAKSSYYGEHELWPIFAEVNKSTPFDYEDFPKKIRLYELTFDTPIGWWFVSGLSKISEIWLKTKNAEAVVAKLIELHREHALVAICQKVMRCTTCFREGLPIERVIQLEDAMTAHIQAKRACGIGPSNTKSYEDFVLQGIVDTITSLEDLSVAVQLGKQLKGYYLFEAKLRIESRIEKIEDFPLLHVLEKTVLLYKLFKSGEDAVLNYLEKILRIPEIREREEALFEIYEKCLKMQLRDLSLDVALHLWQPKMIKKVCKYYPFLLETTLEQRKKLITLALRHDWIAEQESLEVFCIACVDEEDVSLESVADMVELVLRLDPSNHKVLEERTSKLYYIHQKLVELGLKQAAQMEKHS